MMGFIGMGNNPMIGATVACAVAVFESIKIFAEKTKNNLMMGFIGIKILKLLISKNKS